MNKIAILALSLFLLPGFVSAERGLDIVTNRLPSATIGQPYSAKIWVKGGSAPYTWTTLSTTYPAGCCVLGLNGNYEPTNTHYITFDTQSSPVVIDTYPAGKYYWTIKVEDANGSVSIQTISLVIKPAQ